MRMLIIEDEKEIRDFLSKSFEKDGYAVDTASDGQTGSYLARTTDYDIMIIDHILPKKLGLEVVKEVRESLRSNPIIMLSAKTEIPHKIQSFAEGVDDYMVKPFSFQELSARVKNILKRSPYSIKADIYKIEDLTIDLKGQEVTRNGKKIYLTRKEFLILECLAKEPGKVISRGTIMEHAWNMNTDPFSNTLETHMANLRRKISNKRKKKVLIKTVPGRGYKI